MEVIKIKWEETVIRGLTKEEIPAAIDEFIEEGSDVGIGREIDGTYVVSSMKFRGTEE